MWIDTHCHLDKVVRADGLDVVLARMTAADVRRCITVGTCQQDWELYRGMAKAHPGVIAWTVGIHPCDVTEGWEDPLAAIASYFATSPQPVALGEIGLDYFHLSKYPDEAAAQRQMQQAAFREQLAIALQLDCPVVVHSRQAVEDCIRLIDASGVDWRKVVFHCFTDGPELLRPILERGGQASFTGILTYKSRSVDPIRAAARLQGVERLMLETDAPYLSPEPVRGTSNEPAQLRYIGAFAAALLGVPIEELARQTSANALRFFGLETY